MAGKNCICYIYLLESARFSLKDIPGRRRHFERSAPESNLLFLRQLNSDEEEIKKIRGVEACGYRTLIIALPHRCIYWLGRMTIFSSSAQRTPGRTFLPPGEEGEAAVHIISLWGAP